MADALDSVTVEDLDPSPAPEAPHRSASGEADVGDGAASPGDESGDPTPLSPGDICSEGVFVATFIGALDLASGVTGLASVAGTGDPQADQAARAAYRICLRNPALHWMLRDTAWMIDYGVLAMFAWGKWRGLKDEIDERHEPPARPSPPAGVAPVSDLPQPGEVVIDGAHDTELPEAA